MIDGGGDVGGGVNWDGGGGEGNGGGGGDIKPSSGCLLETVAQLLVSKFVS